LRGLLETLFWTVGIVRRAGIKPWSVEGSALVRLILSAARRSRGASETKRRKQHVLEVAQRFTNTKKGRERIAHALDVSSIDAWMVQESLRRVVEELQGRSKATPELTSPAREGRMHLG
jgi:hypothetical protein